ncbi:MAG: CPBP family intramembrane metalloprotease [Chloroflexi bacterium]|nr:MAG: CPBP family intramembrane metalloprotease [Chloroflexota bacterium]
MDVRPRPGLLQLAGREAPALYVLGLLASIGGGALFFAAIAGAGQLALAIGLLTLSAGLIGLSGASALQRFVDTPESSWRGPGPLALFWTALPLAILAPGLLIPLFAPFGGIGQLDAATATLAIAISTNLATTLVVALTVVGTGAARWGEIAGEHHITTPNLPAADRRGGAIGDVAWGVALTIPIVVAAALFSALLIQSTGAVPESPLPPSDDSRALLINLLSAVIVAPIGEEILYRGVIAQAWGRQSGSRRAIVFSAVVFAFAHTLNIGGESIGDALAVAGVAFAIRLPLGLALGWLWVRRRSLLATIVLHAAYNAVLVLVTFAA